MRYKMLCFLDIKKTSFWNLGKKVGILGVGGEIAQKVTSFLVLQLSETDAN